MKLNLGDSLEPPLQSRPEMWPVRTDGSFMLHLQTRADRALSCAGVVAVLKAMALSARFDLMRYIMSGVPGLPLKRWIGAVLAARGYVNLDSRYAISMFHREGVVLEARPRGRGADSP